MIATRSARVESPLGDKALLFLSMTAREALGRPFSYTVDVLAEDDTLDFSSLLGQVMTVELELPLLSTREFSGYVTELSLVGQLGRYVRYRVQLNPWLSLLGHTTTSRIFQNQSVPDVVKQIFRDHGYSDFTEALNPGGYRVWEYLVQYRESDLNFVSRLLEQEGIYYFFKHKDKKHTLVLADSYNSHEKTPGYEELPYFPPQPGERRERDHIESWRTSRQIRPGAFVATDFDFEKPKLKLSSTLQLRNDHAKSEHELYDYPGEFRNLNEAEVQVRLRLEEHQTDYEVARGVSNARGLQTGALFSLTDFPREDQNKEYLVTESHYEVRVNDYESLGVPSSEQDYICQFKAMDSKRPFRARRITPKPVVEGPQTAIVVGDQKQDIWTDDYGRIKVKFHWDRRESAADDARSCWVRVAQIWAGSGFGGIHIPRIGQEVLIDFLEGDPDRPIVTGCLYNADNKPPYTLPANKTQSGIKSRSVTGGSPDNFNEIRFEDRKGEEELHVQAEKDYSTLVKHDQSTTIGHDRTTEIARNDTLKITGDQFIHIHGNLSMTVDGVTDSKNPDKGKPIKSSMAVTGAHDMKASDSISLSAPNKITLTVNGSSITITPSAIMISAGGGASVVLDANLLAAAAGKAQLKLDDKVVAKSPGKSELQLDAKIHMKSGDGAEILMDPNIKATSAGGSKVLIDAHAVLLDAETVKGTGTQDASIVSGPASMKCSAAGAEVNSPNTNIKGSAMVNIAGALVKIN